MLVRVHENAFAFSIKLFNNFVFSHSLTNFAKNTASFTIKFYYYYGKKMDLYSVRLCSRRP